jgi:hypothetical protein
LLIVSLQIHTVHYCFQPGKFIDFVHTISALHFVHIFVFISVPPEVIVSPRVAANIGETATLKCLAQANPPPVFYWFRQSQRVTNRSNIMVYEQTTGGTATFEGYLQIKSTQQDDFGDYVCEVNNSWGQIRRTVTLSVTGI